MSSLKHIKTFEKKMLLFVASFLILHLSYAQIDTVSINRLLPITTSDSNNIDEDIQTELNNEIKDTISPIVPLQNNVDNTKRKSNNGKDLFVKKDTLITRPPLQNGLIIYPTRSEILFKKGEIISNVLCVVNETKKKVSFITDISAPTAWQPFTSKNKVWELEAGDSVFIPIRIVPKSSFTGSSRFMFSVFLYTPEDDFLGYSMFTAFTEKQLKWELNVSDSKIYLMNFEKSAPFSVSLFNQGPEQQTIQLQMIGLSRNIFVTDSLNKDVNRRPITTSLESYKDTTFHMIFYEKVKEKNSSHIDIDNYNPFKQIESKKYQIFFRSVSPTPSEVGRFQSSKKIEFVRLSSELEVNRYGSDVLPLEVDMNVHSLFGNQPVMNIFMRGNTEFSNQSMLSYMVKSYFDNNHLN